MASITEIIQKYGPALQKVRERSGIGPAPQRPEDSLATFIDDSNRSMGLDIKDLIDDIIKREGGYVNHPNDKGGPTKYGITQRTLSNFLGRPATEEDVKSLSKETAAQIYEAQYVRGPGFDRLPPEIQANVTDFGVMRGPAGAVRTLQETLKQMGLYRGEVDGIAGPQTQAALQAAQETKRLKELNNLYVDQRLVHHNRVVGRDPSQNVFLKGWSNRAEKFRG